MHQIIMQIHEENNTGKAILDFIVALLKHRKNEHDAVMFRSAYDVVIEKHVVVVYIGDEPTKTLKMVGVLVGPTPDDWKKYGPPDALNMPEDEVKNYFYK